MRLSLLLSLSALFLVLAGRFDGAWASSSGEGLYTCNALDERIGCPAEDFKNGYHMACQTKDPGSGGKPFPRVMHWASRAKRDGRFRITAGREHKPRTYYRPGEILDIHVRHLDFVHGHTYRGIMMHFQQSANPNTAGKFSEYTQSDPSDPFGPVRSPNVGTWVVPPASPRMFHSELNNNCGPSVLLHATAGYKSSHQVFKFKTPPAGTGRIALRALIKTGDANMGSFHFPMEAGDLVLTEKAARHPSSMWFRGELGESCDQVCARQTQMSSPKCAEPLLASGLASSGLMMRHVNKQNVVTCDLPFFTNCGELGPTTNEYDQCFVYAADKCKGRRDSAAPTCAAKSTNPLNGRRLCPCYSGALASTCIPKTCYDFPDACGSFPDGCGGVTPICDCPDMSSCNSSQLCQACVPATCGALGADCGLQPDGCGGTIDCGGCQNGTEFCFDNRKCQAVGCTPSETCQPDSCGTLTTSCIEDSQQKTTVNCGSCTGFGDSCSATNLASELGTCGCSPRQCPANQTCGSINDGCGDIISCGVCGPNDPCQASTLTCQAITCSGPNQVLQAGACVCAPGFTADPSTYECVKPGDLLAAASSAVPTARGGGSSLLVLAASALAAFSPVMGTRAGLLFVATAAALGAAVQPTAAHNWISSPSRARFASTQAPFPPREDAMPHVQISRGDTFQIEYVQGHTKDSYFVVHKNSDEGNVKDVTTGDLDDYLDQATRYGAPDAKNYARGPLRRRYHRRCGEPVRGEELTNDVFLRSEGSTWTNNYFERVVPPGDAAYFGDRPLAFTGNGDCRFQRARGASRDNGGDDAQSQQLQYKQSDIANDKRARYANPKWPWIIEVVRTTHTINQPKRPDVLLFDLPRTHNGAPVTAGHYQVSWRWRGYYDAVDVDYQDNLAPSVPEDRRYGGVTKNAPFRRVDHSFWNIRNGYILPAGDNGSPNNNGRLSPQGITRVRQDADFGDCPEVVADASVCMARCTGSCQGVVVAPLVLPPGVNEQWRAQYTNAAGYNSLIPWGRSGDHCDPRNFPSQASLLSNPDARVCFRADADAGNGTQGDYITVNDPENPIFYHSLIIRSTGRNFTILPSSPFFISDTSSPSFTFSGACVDCDEKARKTPVASFPVWHPETSNCQHCDLEPSVEAPEDFSDVQRSIATEMWGRRLGMFDDSANGHCESFGPDLTPVRDATKRLTLSDSPRMSWFDCQQMAIDDPDCGNLVMLDPRGSTNGLRFLDSSNPNGECRCQLASQPGTCNSKSETTSTNGYRVFEIKKAPADPTCATGVKDDTGNYCCSGTCRDSSGAVRCDEHNLSGRGGERGFCSRMMNVPTWRTCDKYGPPCRSPR